MRKTVYPVCLTASVLFAIAGDAPQPGRSVLDAPDTVTTGDPADHFRTADRCIACHKDVTASDGTDVSIGFDWRASMMANAARDPYFQAAVRREIMDYPEAAADIEGECARCHMPMATVAALQDGRSGEVFANLPIGGAEGPWARPCRRRRLLLALSPDPARRPRHGGDLHRPLPRFSRNASRGPARVRPLRARTRAGSASCTLPRRFAPHSGSTSRRRGCARRVIR